MRHRIPEQCTRLYGQTIEWVEGVTDKGPFPVTNGEWRHFFIEETRVATLSVILLAETILNCRFVTCTPLDPVPKDKEVAPDASWIWKDVTQDHTYGTAPVSPRPIFLFNQMVRHYIQIYSLETIY